MPDTFGLPSDVFFGDAESPLPDWRETADEDNDSDDESEDEIQPGVAEMLGFDPSEVDEE